MKTNELKALTALFSDRQVRWACQFHAETKNLFTVAQMRAKLEDLMRIPAETEYWGQSLLASEALLLPEEELSWIHKDDLRLLRWLVVKCQQQHHDDQPLMQLPQGYNPDSYSQNLHDTLIRAVDLWKTSLEIKKDSLKKLKSEWSRVLLKNLKFKWLDEKNNAQIEWAWAYVNNYINKQGLRTFRFTPTTLGATYIDILSTFDNWTADRINLHELQTNLKQAWAQRKYRQNLEKKNKRPSTYALNNETKSQLEALAKANNVSLNQMLEHIIGEAYKNARKEKI